MMSEFPLWDAAALHLVLQALLIIRVMLRPRREPAARMAWVLVILVAPVVGMVSYLLFGETNIGTRRVAGFRRTLAELPPPTSVGRSAQERALPDVPRHFATLFRTGTAINGFPMLAGNRAQLLADSDTAIDAIVADIDRKSVV